MIKQEQSKQVRTSLTGPLALLGKAWQIYKQNWFTLSLIALAPLAAQLLVGMLGMGLLVLLAAAFGLKDFGAVEGMEQLLTNPIPLILSFLIVALVFGLVLIVFQIWSRVAMISAVGDNQLGFKQAFQQAWSKIRAYYWVSLLFGLIFFTGFLFLAIPGLVIAVWFSLAVFVLMNEDVRGLTALLKSREYIKGYWWPVLGRVLFFGGVLFISSVIYLALVSGLRDLFKTSLPFVPTILQFVPNVVVAPLIIAYFYSLYKDLRVLKGEFEFVPSGGAKAFWSFLAAVPILLLVAAIVFSIAWLPRLFEEAGQSIRQELPAVEPYSFDEEA